MNNQPVRSFIAIALPEDLKSGLTQLQNELKLAGYAFIKWVAPEGIHLTLKFLGNISPQKIAGVTKAMEKACDGVTPFQLETEKLGAFPNLRRPRVFWLGIGGELDQLTSLQQRVDMALIPLGFSKEKRTFTPHLTLARMRERASLQDQQDFGRLIISTSFKDSYKVNVASLNLIRSQLLPSGAVYSHLAEVSLKL